MGTVSVSYFVCIICPAIMRSRDMHGYTNKMGRYSEIEFGRIKAMGIFKDNTVDINMIKHTEV
jgi:hypothetical protein